jgi:NAD(P)-dependent dehydrogenase (short-subunit alcohol dehydrogenase family)
LSPFITHHAHTHPGLTYIYAYLLLLSVQGIGRGIVEEFGGLGATIFTCARTQKDLDEALLQWQEDGIDAYGIVADCSKSEVLDSISVL